jgi:hypothetical protein
MSRWAPEPEERLDINVELASPLDFVPMAHDWDLVRYPAIDRKAWEGALAARAGPRPR